jgi:hypothetical protein
MTTSMQTHYGRGCYIYSQNNLLHLYTSTIKKYFLASSLSHLTFHMNFTIELSQLDP